MFYSPTSSRKINKIHERALRLIFNDYSSEFSELLFISNDVSIHQRCIYILMTEVYKYLNGLSPDIMNEIFLLKKNSHNLRSTQMFVADVPKTTNFVLNSVIYRANQLWPTVPTNIKASSLQLFKENIELCCCQLCKQFMPNLGYLV